MQEGTLHLWGFETWFRSQSAGEFLNPGELFIESIDSGRRERLLELTGMQQLRTTIFPVPDGNELQSDLDAFRDFAKHALDQVSGGDKVVGFGQGYFFQMPFRLETNAVNRFQGVAGGDTLEVIPGGHDLGMEAARVERLKAKIQADPDLASKIGVSTDAGVYYCNALLELMLNRGLGGTFFHLPRFLKGSEAQAKVLFDNNLAIFAANYPGRGYADFTFGSTDETYELLCRYFELEREL